MNKVVFVLLILISASFVYSQKKSAKARVSPSTRTAATPVSPQVSDPLQCAGSNGFTKDEMIELLAAHNRVRADVHVAPIVWDCKLAAFAQEWAIKAVTAHRDTEFGESIFVSSNPAEPVKTVVDRWVREKDYWDNSKAVCQTGKVCNHYTQAVWKETRKIGCAINRAATGQWKTFVVCNYDPSGNWPGPAY